jgi:asparagine synthase (glutamine-hydrolysing)
MCGIAGLLSPRPVVDAEVVAMADALYHRGPDDGGAWCDPGGGFGVAQRRLSIIDLSAAGHQPMHSRCGRFVLVLNGEIYNHQDIRREIDAIEQVAWHGHSDTETLLEAIRRWGLEAALERAIGMFAIALWDRESHRLRLARDRIGEKPLFYGWVGDGIAFASELKALRRAPGFANPVDEGALELFFRYSYVPAPFSILRRIYKVEPGTIVTLDARAIDAPADKAPRAPFASDGLTADRFWVLADAGGADTAPSDEAAIDRLEALLTDAVRQQTLAADVPVGAFLSGGIDSSLIVALMRKSIGANVKTFTIGVDTAGYDEARFAGAVARHLETDHTELYVSPEEARAIIPLLPTVYDEPFADASQIPTFLVSKLARQRVTVALSGDGGDELFGGYNRYVLSRRMWRLFAPLPSSLRRLAGHAVTAVPPSAWDLAGRLPFMPDAMMFGEKAHKYGRALKTGRSMRDLYFSFVEQWHDGAPVRLAETYRAPVEDMDPVGESPEEQMMYWDMMSYLPDDILAKVDRASMYHSLEVRVPFLDHRVVSLARQTALTRKLRGGQGKWILRQLLDRHVPRSLIERPKSGFGIPIGGWLRNELKDWAADLLTSPLLDTERALDEGVIHRRWQQHCRGTHDWSAPLWSVLMFRAWARNWR